MAFYTILVCDDKEAVHESLSFFLRKEGMEVLDAYDGAGTLLQCASHQVDLAVLDVSLPDMDGMEVCRLLRRNSEIPIIFLSARTEEEDRIAGLEIGGDDFICRGIGKQVLFEEEMDYKYYLNLLKRFSQECDVTLIAYCLMENHVHMLVNDPGRNISKFMQKTGITYSGYFNRKYDRSGHLFQDRFLSETNQPQCHTSGINCS